MTMTDPQLLLIALLLPLALIPVQIALSRIPNLREAATLTAAAALFAVALTLALRVGEGARPELVLAHITQALSLKFALEPLGAVFMVLASGLWFVNSVYSIGYMRGGKETNQTRFYVFFAVAISATMGVAMAADLLTLFVFYEALTLSTYPLVSHKGTDTARAGARIYLGILITASLALFLPAIIFTYGVAGTLDFTVGGLLPTPEALDQIQGPTATLSAAAATSTFLSPSTALYGVILVMFVFGIGKAAIMPIHPWLPNAMVAPTPVSALLHAVAVVKAGVFTMLKLSLYVFGPGLMQDLPVAKALTWVAAGSIVLASLIAIAKDNLKARLAYSTVSQLSYVTLGAMIATPAALLGGALQMVFHAFGKITLFMCAGAIYVGAKKTEISTLGGLARTMPWTFGAFAIGAASIIGLPPLAGAWPKLYLMLGAVDAGVIAILAALVISSILNIIYLGVIPAKAALMPGAQSADKSGGAPVLAVLPAIFTAAMCVVLFLCAGPLIDYLSPIVSSAEPSIADVPIADGTGAEGTGVDAPNGEAP